MTAGRRPKPTKQKQLAGNPGKRALNTSEPEFAAITNVECPAWLQDKEFAGLMWETVCPQLCSQELLTTVDLHNLEAFCAAYDRWRRAEDEVDKLGLVVEGAQGGWVKNPACTVANESLRQLNTFGALLGLDPSSRTRLIGPTKKKKSNEFAEF